MSHPVFTDKFRVFHGDPAAQENGFDPADLLFSFVNVIIHTVRIVREPDHTSVLWIKDDDIRVRPHLDRSLLREYSVDLCRGGSDQFDEFRPGDFPFSDAFRPDHVESVTRAR